MKKEYLLLVLIFVINISCGKKYDHALPTAGNTTKIIAHRGASAIAPENTLIAFQKAIESGAEYFELDVHRTKDDSIIVIHDRTVDRTSSNNKKGKISKMTYQELSDVKVGFSEKFSNKYTDEKIPTLREALQLAKGKIKVCVEIKVHDIEEDVLQIINELKVKNEVIIFSFYFDVLTKIRQLDNNIPILYLIDYANNGTIQYAKLINANAIGVGYSTNPSNELINMAHKNGIEIWKWTVNDEAEMQSLIRRGLDGLITNFPKKALQKRNGFSKKQ